MFNRFLFAFSSLTIATTLAAFACEDGSSLDASDSSSSQETVLNVKDVTGTSAAIPANLGARTDMVQTLGFLKPGTVLPTPTIPYDYEKERKKEIARKHKRQLALKKKREAAARAKAEAKAAAEAARAEELTKPEEAPVSVQEQKPDLNKIITEEQTIKNVPSTMPKPENKPLDTTPNAAPVAPVSPVAPSAQPSSSAQPRKDDKNASSKTEEQKPEAAQEKLAEVKKEAAAASEPKVEEKVAKTEAAPIAPVASSETKTEQVAKSDSSAITASTTVGRITALDYTDSELEIAAQKQPVLDAIVDDMKKDPNKIVKIQSYGYSKDGNASEARRNSFQRAIKVRKYLIDREISASRISVNAIDDAANKLNRVEIMFEENKAL